MQVRITSNLNIEQNFCRPGGAHLRVGVPFPVLHTLTDITS